MPLDVVAPEDSPARQLERQELRDRMCAVIERLPDRERMVIELFELEGFDSADIADILDSRRGTVRWHLHEARRKLREQLVSFHGSDGRRADSTVLTGYDSRSSRTLLISRNANGGLANHPDRRSSSAR